MEKFYQLKMRNGKSFIVSTNKDGVCKFSIDRVEFCIFSDGMENGNFMFFIGEDDTDDQNPKANQWLEAVSLQEIHVKKNIKDKKINKCIEELRNNVSKTKRSFLKWKHTIYFAQKGGIHTPDGWLLA